MIYKMLKNIAGACLGLAMMTGTANALPVQVDYNDIVASTLEDFEGFGNRVFNGSASFNGFDVYYPGNFTARYFRLRCESSVSSEDLCLYSRSRINIRTFQNFGDGAKNFGVDLFNFTNNDSLIITVTGVSGVSTFGLFIRSSTSRFLGFGDDEGLLSVSFEYARLTSSFRGYSFDDVITDAPSLVPVPAALPLFGTGLAVMGILGWRRKRKILRD